MGSTAIGADQPNLLILSLGSLGQDNVLKVGQIPYPWKLSVVWFACGGGIALVIVALAAAGCVLAPTSPRGIAVELSRAFVIVSAACAFAVTTAKLGWLFARHALGMRVG